MKEPDDGLKTEESPPAEMDDLREPEEVVGASDEV